MTDPKEIDFSSLEKALASLKQALEHPPKNDLERDGVIQRFEYTFELCWKFIRRSLLTMGRSEVSNSPRPLFRDAFEEHWISDPKPWFGFLEARNEITHTYDSRQADKVFQMAGQFPPYAESLLGAMKKRAQG
jgi:nucleotidyltransferase substrate binding protein (TIGR01987 family)